MLVRRDTREHDQTISVLTREKGRLDFVARGIKKAVSKNSATLQQCAFVEIDTAAGKQMDYITTAQPLELFSAMRQDVHKSIVVQYATVLVYRMLQIDEPEPRVFDLLMSYLHYVNNATVHPLLPTSFAVKFFALLGFSPVLDQCVVSGEQEVSGFSVVSGGAVSLSVATQKRKEGEDVFPFDMEQQEVLQELLQKEWSIVESVSLSPLQETQLKRLVGAFIQYQTTTRLPQSYDMVIS